MTPEDTKTKERNGYDRVNKILEILEGGIELEHEENYNTFNDNRVASEIEI